MFMQKKKNKVCQKNLIDEKLFKIIMDKMQILTLWSLEIENGWWC